MPRFWKVHSYKFFLTACRSLLLGALLLCSPAFLQRSSAQESAPSSPANKEPVPFLRHHVGMGLSFAGGTPTLGGNGAMLSALYGYSITPMIEAEFSLNYLGRTNSPSVQGTHFANGWTGDITFMFRLFDASDRFRIGIGPSLLWQGFTGGGGSSTDPNGTTHFTPMQAYESTSLGGNLKVEYSFPLSQKMDLGLRGQIHLATEPFSGVPYMPNSVSGSAGIGIFVRGGW
ncbi:MAG: hypothetical protein MUF71_14380 [Candidatus Kapabacteria bacterium]|jgi:hypothetical protein|nr:hypothetical protein [Candidatus Kapabacteria bacterium]